MRCLAHAAAILAVILAGTLIPSLPARGEISEAEALEFTDFIREFGRTVRRALPGRLAGAYHGYTFLGYTPEGTTACCAEMLATGDIDFLWSTNPDYALLSNRHYALHSLFHRYTKLASTERTAAKKVESRYSKMTKPNRRSKPV